MTSAVASCGAVWRSSRTSHDRSASNTTSATREPLVLVGGVRPRVVELVEDVGVDAARAPLAVVRLGRAVALDRDVVRVDLGADAVEQDPPLAPDGASARPAARGGCAVSSSTIAPRNWLRTCSPRSATASDGLEDRLGARRARRRRPRAGPNSVGNIVRQPSASVVSPFITARARTRWAGVASASSSAARATSGSAWMPA